MRVIANARLVQMPGNERTEIQHGAWTLHKPARADGARVIACYAGGTLLVAPAENGAAPSFRRVLPEDAPHPVLQIELSAEELRLLVVEAMQLEGMM